MKPYARLLAIAVAVATPIAAHGDPLLTGQISIVGSSKTTSTGVTFASFGVASPTAASGSLQDLFSSLTPFDLASLQNFTYAAVNNSSKGQNIFEVFSTGAAGNLTVDLTSVTESTCNGDHICLAGTGLLEDSGYDETPASFDLTTQESAGNSTFLAVIAASPAPEPSSLLLLGTGLLGTAAALYRRKRLPIHSEGTATVIFPQQD